MHAAHGCAHDQAQVVHAQAFGHQLVLGGDHVVIDVAGEPGVQAVGRLGGLPVAQGVGEDDVVARRIQQPARREQHPGEHRIEELAPRAAGAVDDQHRIGHVAGGVAARRPQGEVVQPHFRQGLAGAEVEIAGDVVALVGAGRIGVLGQGGSGEGEGEPEGGGETDQQGHGCSPSHRVRAQPRPSPTTGQFGDPLRELD